ncbi:peptidylprolyl isomerase [Candidatus Omnitrophota bacterium]
MRQFVVFMLVVIGSAMLLTSCGNDGLVGQGEKGSAEIEEQAMSSAVVENGRKVQLEYSIQVDGHVVDASNKGFPFQYTHGTDEVVLGLDPAQLEGMRVGETKSIVAKDAYGPVNPDAFREVPKSTFPDVFDPKVGQMFQVPVQDGRPMPATVVKVNEETIVLNFNHPLAGRDVQYDIRIMAIE